LLFCLILVKPEADAPAQNAVPGLSVKYGVEAMCIGGGGMRGGAV